VLARHNADGGASGGSVVDHPEIIAARKTVALAPYDGRLRALHKEALRLRSHIAKREFDEPTVTDALLKIAADLRSYNLAAIMHDVARFYRCVERTSVSNPTGWIGVMPLAVQRVWG
jgi:hypothetical protein